MGSMLTDAAIRAALRKIKTGTKTAITLADAAPRGAGRLLLVVKPDRAEWYGRHFVAGRKRMAKLGDFPAVSLAEARELFAGSGPAPGAPVVAEKGVTVGELFNAYVESLRVAGKPSAKQAERVLELAGAVIGRARPAGAVRPADIVAVIRPIYERGARVQADKFRMYMGAAFRWAMRSAHDYRVEDARDWGVAVNPVDAVPRDAEAEGVGSRWLSRAEFFALLGWLRGKPARSRTRVRAALLLMMLTGQRAREILSLRAGQWDSGERLLSWEKTKNGRPHVLPVCSLAAAILDGLEPSAGGWLFPNESGPDKHMPDGSALMTLRRYSSRHGVQDFTCRDLRRTWKTLAGEAGLSKVERDLLQNHTEADVSSRHYDRYEYLREKREAVGKWERWLVAQKDWPGAIRAGGVS